MKKLFPILLVALFFVNFLRAQEKQVTITAKGNANAAARITVQFNAR